MLIGVDHVKAYIADKLENTSYFLYIVELIILNAKVNFEEKLFNVSEKWDALTLVFKRKMINFCVYYLQLNKVSDESNSSLHRASQLFEEISLVSTELNICV